MDTSYITPQPGLYQYTYPTFVDTAQYICVHFWTPDGQQAFVSYPHNRARRAAELVSISWFESVTLCRLEGQPQLMSFLGMLFIEKFTDGRVQLKSNQWLPNNLAGYEFSQELMA
ncbi:MAG: hypothetical protein EOO85_27795 [Pedobacter sp.]|nr:MAG: hypothetical protein EOO85_27795 [Pedobacter sp.]